eukprot:5660417-Prymnesium_polylepis.1
MSDRQEPWLLLTLARRGHMTALQPSSSFAAAVLSGQIGDWTALDAPARAGCLEAAASASDPA